MHDLKFIRENPQQFDVEMKRRGLDAQSSEILELDEKRRNKQTAMQELQAQRNSKSKQIGILKSQGNDSEAQEIMQQVANMKNELQNLENKERELSESLTYKLSTLPNIMYSDVPSGNDENDNQLVRTVGDIPKFDFTPKEHWELGENLGMMDFEYSAKLSGSRFVSLNRDLAKLERAIASFMLDTHTNEHGYTEYQTPVLVKQQALLGTGQLPKFEEDLFKTNSDHYLIPTSEVTLTNYANDVIFEQADLPKRMTAWTLCFRSEAGSAGRDTRGMLRQHQFYKVEMVSIVEPENSDEELERMTNCAENILNKLKLPYRVVKLCTGDTGFGAKRTYDIEVWVPGQDTYREISSCSTCGDFQARRMKGRYRKKGQKSTEFLHTLNGSGLAVGRTMIAIMENYQNSDGSINIPDVLQPYMGGKTIINKD
ncbi:MAG: serine--tRNA ligase [Alphaproteobacteria bacterium]|jgi:seryl-tRNA synthetase|nr:serine--tRNA ligase [Alphaproteobacteria bacterium]